MSSYLSVIFSYTGVPICTIMIWFLFYISSLHCVNAESYNSGILVMKLSSVKKIIVRISIQ